MADLRHDAFRIREHVGIPETQDTECLAGEPQVAIFVCQLVLWIGVPATVDFDHEPASHASEVDDIASQGDLAPKMKSLPA